MIIQVTCKHSLKIRNSYKNITKLGVQKQGVVNNAAIKSIQHHLKQNPNNTYLFENADGTCILKWKLK